MANPVQVEIAVTRSAQGFTGVFVEQQDVTKAMLPTGGGWFADLPNVEPQSDGDVDIAVIAAGFPTVDCTVEVKVGARPKRSKTKRFSSQGFAVFVFEEPVPDAQPESLLAADTDDPQGGGGHA